MSTTGGPKLKGIGRSGDSDIVLCMDAHDAGSYPGEPTSNVFKHAANGYPIGWWGDGANQSFANIETLNVYDRSLQYNGYPTVLWTPGTSLNCYLNGTADIPNTELSTVWTFSCYIKAQDGGTLGTSNNYLNVYLYHPSTGSATGTTVDVGNGWYRVFRSVSGSSNYVGLAGFSSLRAGVKFYLSGPQLEKKTYPTPYVTGFPNSGEVYDGRPASTNLMIHGNVDGSFPNLIPEALSKFETSSGWSLFGNFTINSSTEVAEVTNSSGTNLLQRAYSPAQITAGERYIVTGDVTTTAGTLRTRVGDGSYSVLATGVGSSVEVVAGSTTTETVLFWADGWKGTLDNVGVSVAPPFEDSSPSKHTITANGHVTHSNAQSKFSGGAIYFDGSVDSLTTNSSSDFAFGTGDFTIDCWVYKTATEYFETYFDTYSYSGNGILCGLWGTDSTISFYSEGGIGWTAPGGTAVALNTWTHLAWVRDGNTLRMFVDGVQQGTATLSSSDDYTSTYLRIGGRLTDEFIFGYMDEMRVTKGTALWTHAFTPPTRRNDNGPVVDLSGHDNGGNFATTAMTDVKTYQKGQVIEPVASAVWDFDGTDDRIECSTNSFDLKCFELAIQQWQAVTPDGGMGAYYSNVGFTLNDYTGSAGNDLKNGLNIGSWTGGMADETVSWWGYGTGGYWATYIKDTIPVGWHIYTFNWNGSSYDIWIDGVKKTTYYMTAHAALFQGVVTVSLGLNQGWDYYFKGKMGCVRCYDISLTDQQIKQNFNNQRSRFKV